MSSGLDTRSSAETFDVAELVKMAWRGQIRVPDFQRGFRWGREDVRRLLDSIVKGYPVGHLLLWVHDAPNQTLRLGALRLDAPAMKGARWVVDGQQRITSLANALHESGQADPRFAFAYDLRNERFVPRSASDNPLVLPLPVLFDLQRITKWFVANPDISDYLDHAAYINKILRQFPIPASLVEHDDEDVLRDIFDRMNNYGKRLSRAEVFAALYAGDPARQDETLTIGLIAREIDIRRGFGIVDDDTILRAILARRGPDVTREIRDEFDNKNRSGIVEFPNEDRDQAYDAGMDALLNSVRFLQETAGVPHLSFLPYRFLIVVLTRFFAHHPTPDQRQLQLLRRWFWRAAVVGPYIFRGSATGAMKAMTYRIERGTAARSLDALLEAVDRDEHPLPDVSRFRTNEGAGKITLCSMWNLNPRSLATGDEGETTSVGETIDRMQLSNCLGERSTAKNAVGYVISARSIPADQRLWAANRILVPTPEGPPDEIDRLLTGRSIDLDEQTWAATIASHGITPEMSAMLTEGDVTGFLIARQDLLRQNLQRFLDTMCEWRFEDTPSLTDLLVEDEENTKDDDVLR